MEYVFKCREKNFYKKPIDQKIKDVLCDLNYTQPINIGMSDSIHEISNQVDSVDKVSLLINAVKDKNLSIDEICCLIYEHTTNISKEDIVRRVVETFDANLIEGKKVAANNLMQQYAAAPSGVTASSMIGTIQQSPVQQPVDRSKVYNNAVEWIANNVKYGNGADKLQADKRRVVNMYDIFSASASQVQRSAPTVIGGGRLWNRIEDKKFYDPNDRFTEVFEAASAIPNTRILLCMNTNDGFYTVSPAPVM